MGGRGGGRAGATRHEMGRDFLYFCSSEEETFRGQGEEEYRNAYFE